MDNEGGGVARLDIEVHVLDIIVKITGERYIDRHSHPTFPHFQEETTCLLGAFSGRNSFQPKNFLKKDNQQCFFY